MDKMEIILGLCHENAEIKMIQQLFFKSVVELPDSCWTQNWHLGPRWEVCQLKMKSSGMQNQVFFGLNAIRSF